MPQERHPSVGEIVKLPSTARHRAIRELFSDPQKRLIPRICSTVLRLVRSGLNTSQLRALAS